MLPLILALLLHVVSAGTLNTSDESLLWGPYRSNLYFGVRPRGIPHSLLTGFMWYNSDTFNGIRDLRHSCETGDDMQGYGWTQYDPRSGGIEVIRDNQNEVDLTFEFVKTSDGHNWAVRVKGTPRTETSTTTIVFYAGLEGMDGGELKLKNELKPSGFDGSSPVILEGNSTPIGGEFDITVTAGENKHPSSDHPVESVRPAENYHYASLFVPDDNVWKAKDIFLALVQDGINLLAEQYKEEMVELPPYDAFLLQNDDKMSGNVHYIQKVFEGPFEFDVIYNSGTKRIQSEDIKTLLGQAVKTFEGKFEAAVDLQPPFSQNRSEYLPFAQEMLSNLMGGIGYFYGTSLVDRENVYYEDEENFWEESSLKLAASGETGQEEGPYELFTSVPSRPFFPRGFYWDEGFHLIPILEYDNELALEILKSWFSLIDEDGWIAREQILGPEARSKVPPEFRIQYPHYANPPTMMLIFTKLLDKVGLSTQEFDFGGVDDLNTDQHGVIAPELLDYLKDIYPSLKRHYEWFRTSQKGKIRDYDRESFSSAEGYRWTGRTPNHCLTSGLDDYPRAAVPHPAELHVDLLSWIGMMTQAMKKIATALGESEDETEYARIDNAIRRNLEDLHWIPEQQLYCDLSVDEYEESIPVCHAGYVSLMPFVLKLMPSDEEHVTAILDLISNPDRLWTPFGIRSLSKESEFYSTGENYWRGPIWININYLVLDSLAYYKRHLKTDEQELYDQLDKVYHDLRLNVVNVIKRNWEGTGFAWEQYDPDTGSPKGVKHFLGWTSLVVNIMTMPEHIR